MSQGEHATPFTMKFIVTFLCKNAPSIAHHANALKEAICKILQIRIIDFNYQHSKYICFAQLEEKGY